MFDVTNSKIITTGMSLYSNTSLGVKANSSAGLNIYDTSDNNYAFFRATESSGKVDIRASDGDASAQPFSQITLTGTSSPKIEYLYDSGAGTVTEPLTPGFSGGLKAEYLGSIAKVGSAVTPTPYYQTYTFDLTEAETAGFPNSNGYTATKTVSGTFPSVPVLSYTYLLCKSADLGYAVDDTIDASQSGSFTGAWFSAAFSLTGSTLSIKYVFSGDSTVLGCWLPDLSNSPDYIISEIDYDKWDLVTKMWF